MYEIVLFVFLISILSQNTPCSINLYKLLFAYYKAYGLRKVFEYIFVRALLLNLIALILYLLHLNISNSLFILANILVAAIFLIGFKLMIKFKFAPIDISPAYFGIKLPPSISLGLNLPYCLIPIMLLLIIYSIKYGYSFIIFNIYLIATCIYLFVLIYFKEIIASLDKHSSKVPIVLSIIIISKLIYNFL